ncbi:putative phosphoribosylformylglycinamidine synthase, chloroplastic/mitochondrial [Symbiodinium microadriaticum]|uniref:Putative phosphoribosylformylglycinamidine synthase, chloroplastic/mitochondrial n=1 Tax=Symbiodinium microadriaticum TaxID=2951 RepID=A0A1Q9DX09_SYMMI|nr:putative phosphoribosylformylglycinamidine synthase, chloroplastic/mitochondrial [Symbiodinium microadriaticum]
MKRLLLSLQSDGALERAVAAVDQGAEWPAAADVAELSLVCAAHEELPTHAKLWIDPFRTQHSTQRLPPTPHAMTAPLLHYFRVADLHLSPALQKKAADAGFTMVGSEICFNIQATGSLDADETKKLEYLLCETFEPEKFGSKSFLTGTVMEVGPRQQFTSAWSTNAVSICHSIALTKIVRIEKSRRYQV